MKKSTLSKTTPTQELASHPLETLLFYQTIYVLFSLRQNTYFKSLKPSIACKIFDSMISPILTDDTMVKSGLPLLR